MPRVYSINDATAPIDAVPIWRGTKWGNPFKIGYTSRADAIARFDAYIHSNPQLLAAAKIELAGKNLLCYCAPRPCHGAILLRIANPPTSNQDGVTMTNDASNQQLLNTGDISRLIGPGVVVPSAFIEDTLGIKHVKREKAARLFTVPQTRDILVAIAARMKKAVDDIDDDMLVIPAKPAAAPKASKAPPAPPAAEDDDEL